MVHITRRNLYRFIDIERIFGIQFTDAGDNANTWCPFHENPQTSKTQSLSVSRKGLWKCHGCQARGDVVDFYARNQDISEGEAYKELRKTADAGEIEYKVVDRYVKSLKGRHDILEYLQIYRGLTPVAIEEFKVGWDGARITVPILNSDETKVYNIRRFRYDPPSVPDEDISGPKVISYKGSIGSPRLFPERLLNELHTRIVLCEGEFDCMLANQYGFTCLTQTGGAKFWKHEFTDLIKAIAEKVYICYDNDAAGTEGAKHAARQLVKEGLEVYIVDLKTHINGGDITDFFVTLKRTDDEFDDALEKSIRFETAVTRIVGKPTNVSLIEAAHSDYYFKPIRTKCIVAGKGLAPYMPPKEITATLNSQHEMQIVNKTFDRTDPNLLSTIRVTQNQLFGAVCKALAVPRNHIIELAVDSRYTMEEIYLVPEFGSSTEYTFRRAYYLGKGIKTNRTYELTGYTMPDPKTQEATHVFTDAKLVDTDLDSFELDIEDAKLLKKTFNAPKIKHKLDLLYKFLADGVTRIWGRKELHIAVDMVFHSVRSFEFDRQLLLKGWLECLVLGDSRCGKGFVAEGLCRYYQAGEVISAEATSFAGLVGGIQKASDRNTLVWGKIPLADRRLLVIDEANSLAQESIGKLSRIRSEGVAEIIKIASEKTTARTRLVWIANPRVQGDGTVRTVGDYNHGIESVTDLIETPEDIARFDYAIIVARNDVPDKLINITHELPEETMFTSDICHKLVMWAWSRTADQIFISPEVTQYILTASKQLATQFSASIPLVQREDIRFKLAKLSVAVAARVFSTDSTFRYLVVNEGHVDYAYNFLVSIYSTSTSGYDSLSHFEREHSTIKNSNELADMFDETEEFEESLIEGLLDMDAISLSDLCEFSNMDFYAGKAFLAQLLRCHALAKRRNWYKKRPAFKVWLQKRRKMLYERKQRSKGM